MKQFRLPIFASKIKYYNLRIVPSDTIFNEVIAIKKQFESVFGKLPLSSSKPHITVATFKMNSKNEKLLIEVLEQLSQRESFTLNLGGFGVFERSKTLFLNVQKTKSIGLLHNDLQTLYDKHLKRKLKLFAISREPHMTISKTSGRTMLYQSLQHFLKEDYKKQIVVNHLSLVSRAKYKSWNWERRIELVQNKLETH